MTAYEKLQRRLRRFTGFLQKPLYKAFHDADVRHSLASTRAAQKDFGYQPTHALEQGLELTVQWFANQVRFK